MTEALYNKTDLPSRAVDKAIESLFKGTIDSRKRISSAGLKTFTVT